ncbi:NAD-dependent epimerase/dehydratase family protein [Streptomyces odontomachi]|uniref:NAD-dependent epimerase/dehydratase family protein n=1 Tax=Streptomyces odontomachi TaxID=2944940 RepID=UPI00210BE526|nr:NAD(P)-dependent oxidoreductase [Streptomyces sp. ODS25]
MSAEVPSRPLRTVAVIGATGCVGREVCAAFARQGHDVLAIARRHVPHMDAYKFAELDLAAVEPAELAELLTAHQVDVVVNAAGSWVSTEAEMDQAHVRLVENLVAAGVLLPRPPRIVQMGSIHEYGMLPNGTSVAETAPCEPDTPYARTKLAGARTLLDATREGRADGVVLRLVNVCGPHTSTASFLGAVTAKLRSTSVEKPLELDIADARRDFVDVRDVADAAVLAAERPVAGEIINIGRGQAVAISELVSLLVSAAGLPADVIRVRGTEVTTQNGNKVWIQADVSRAAELLGWRPRVDLAASMRGMWEAAAQE